MSDGMPLVCESSGNMRSCKSGEQLCLTHDASLLTFHERWIDEVLSAAERREVKP
jgi:hypothetical protein